jgi:hypothetical protein
VPIKEDFNKMLATVGLPPLGTRWTSQQLVLGVILAIFIPPLLLLLAMAVGLWRLVTRPVMTTRVNVEPVTSQSNWLSTKECRNCMMRVPMAAAFCPYCRTNPNVQAQPPI